MRSPWDGELSLFACLGVGNRPPSEKKIANSRGMPGGAMVTRKIEPRITLQLCRSRAEAQTPVRVVNALADLDRFRSVPSGLVLDLLFSF